MQHVVAGLLEQASEICRKAVDKASVQLHHESTFQKTTTAASKALTSHANDTVYRTTV